MPPPPRVLEQFYKTKTVEQIEQSDGHKRSGFARVQLDGGSRWTQQWVVLDVGGDCAVVCLARAAGPIKPAEVLSSSHYSAEPLDTEEAQGPSDFCFQLTDFGSSPPRHHLFSVDSAEDRDGWLDAFDDHGVGDGNTGTGFSVTDMTGEYLPPRRLRSPFLFVCVFFSVPPMLGRADGSCPSSLRERRADATDATDHQSVLSFASSVLQPPDEPHPDAGSGGFANSPFATPQAARTQGLPSAYGGGGGMKQSAVTITRADGPKVGLHFTIKSGDGGVYYIIDHVEPGSVASVKGLEVGDRVLSVQGQDVALFDISGEQVMQMMQQRPLHMVTLTKNAQPVSGAPTGQPAPPLEMEMPPSPAVGTPGELWPAQSAERGSPNATRPSGENEAELQRQLAEANRLLSEEKTARQAVETQLRELMSQAQSLQAVNGELRRALEVLDLAQQQQPPPQQQQPPPSAGEAYTGAGVSFAAASPAEQGTPAPAPMPAAVAASRAPPREYPTAPHRTPLRTTALRQARCTLFLGRRL
jgi:hypothetical protein